MLKSLLALGPIVVLGLVGCGGGDDKTSKQDFISKADAICADLEPRGKALEKSDPKTPEDLAEFAQRGQKLTDDGVARLEALSLPSNEEERKGAEAYIAEVKKVSPLADQLGEDSRALKQAAATKDLDQVKQVDAKLQRTAQEIEDASKQGDKLARDYGLKKCGEDS